MSKQKGKITGINGNMLTVEFDGNIIQNEVGYVISKDRRLKSEVIKISGDIAFLQVFEYTKGIEVGDEIEFSGQMLSVQLGPGLLTQIYDGLQNPLPELAEKFGFFLPVGVELAALDSNKKWEFTSLAKKGDKVTGGSILGTVPEGIFTHKVMVPFNVYDECTVEEVTKKGSYKITDKIVKLKNSRGRTIDVTMTFDWPVKVPITAYKDKIQPVE